MAVHVVVMLNTRAHLTYQHAQFALSCRMWTSAPPHLAAMSSSSPPQPQYWFGKPFIFMYWSGVIAETPPKYCEYGSLGGSHHKMCNLKIMSQSAAQYIYIKVHPHTHTHNVLPTCI